ncbi:cytochrome b/b6 domain-containing protein [Chitinophaga parva]|nr:cytochrome b/b6 domain-containing protein [Chitinophaga parva]
MKATTVHKYLHWSIALCVCFMVITIAWEPLRQWHVTTGYGLIALYLLRVVLTKLRGTGYTPPFARSAPMLQRVEGWLYMLFYAGLAVALYTGYMRVHGPESLVESMLWVHIKSMYYLVVFILAQVGYAVLAETSWFSRAVYSKG